jgi:hypothetical protein
MHHFLVELCCALCCVFLGCNIVLWFYTRIVDLHMDYGFAHILFVIAYRLKPRLHTLIQIKLNQFKLHLHTSA